MTDNFIQDDTVKITKRQLRGIILEFWDKDVERFLIDNAAEYHRDSTLDARSIRMLLMDDFMDHVGHSEDPADYEKLINKLAAGETMAEAEGSTKKYDDDSALKGAQSKLPDRLQKGIIDKTVGDREEYEEEERQERNESMKITKRQLRRIIKEEKAKLIKESVHENAYLMDMWNLMLNEYGRQFPEIDMSYYGNKILAAMEEEWNDMTKEQEEYGKSRPQEHN